MLKKKFKGKTAERMESAATRGHLASYHKESLHNGLEYDDQIINHKNCIRKFTRSEIEFSFILHLYCSFYHPARG
jgi:hypothetical protein